MLKFLDGPAAVVGNGLLIRRAPLHLRAVRVPGGNWDALDQLDDEPQPDEAVFAYRQVRSRGTVHVRQAGRGNSGFFVMAEYALVEPQPAEDVLRDTSKWRAWCLAQQAVQRVQAAKEADGGSGGH
jgi:hypothetical protein